MLSSVSAMVFMDDSERAKLLAIQHGVDTGLHLNFTTPFSARAVPAALITHQEKVSRFLRSAGLARAVFHPRLIASFDYVVKAQLDEFERLYGFPACRLDGHHHMHLCSNVLVQKLLPAGTIVRRNVSFAPGEKGFVNRFYRRWQDRILKRRHCTAEYFFALPPLDEERLRRIFVLASRADVEIMTHPVNEAEYRFLMDGAFELCAGEFAIARNYSLRFSREPAEITSSPADAASHAGSAR
jgi:chitin disaccharide deacetylase